MMSILECITNQFAIGAVAIHVKMGTILSQDATLTALLESSILHV
jgi:hypothetical protein